MGYHGREAVPVWNRHKKTVAGSQEDIGGGEMTESSGYQSPQTVLVVEDAPETIALISSLLKGIYRTRIATSGEKGLEIAVSDSPPDLVLLDIIMPGMDGYEVCRRLKAQPNTAEIPIIFLTAKSEIEDEQMGLELGAVDYITKPISPPILMARIKTHLRLHMQNRELQENYRALRKLEELRDNLVHMIVHDLRSPLTYIMGYLDLLTDSQTTIFSQEDREMLEIARGSAETLRDMVSAVLDVSRMESEEIQLNLSDCELVGIAKEALAELEPLKRNRKLSLEAPDDPVGIRADADLLVRVVRNLLGNALKFTRSNGEISVIIQPAEDRVRVLVRDDGFGIPAEYHEKIFDKFGQVETPEHRQKYSTGLGLTFCKLAVQAHYGRIGVESELGHGSTIWFELPSKGPRSIRTSA